MVTRRHSRRAAVLHHPRLNFLSFATQFVTVLSSIDGVLNSIDGVLNSIDGVPNSIDGVPDGRRSENLADLIDRAARHAMAVCNGDDEVEPAVFLGCGLVIRRDAHVVFGRTHALTARDAVHYFRF